VSHPAEVSPVDREPFDPLLLFAAESGVAPAPTPLAKTPQKISTTPAPATVSPELEALRQRAEAAEKSLHEARGQVTTLKREMATLVAASANKTPRQFRLMGAIAGIGTIGALIVGVAAWQGRVATPPPVAVLPEAVRPVAVAPVAVAQQTASPPPSAPVPVMAKVTTERRSLPAPARASSARVANTAAPVSREYFGTLSVDAVPGGAEVFINRKSVGKTPARITGLRAGSHLVWIQRAGYRLWTRVVLVPADKVSRVSVKLEPDNTTAKRP
jgi:hypothetical protein